MTNVIEFPNASSGVEVAALLAAFAGLPALGAISFDSDSLKNNQRNDEISLSFDMHCEILNVVVTWQRREAEMKFEELQARVQALTVAHGINASSVIARDADVDEEQEALFGEMFEEAASLRAELTSLGFGILFNELGETVKSVA